MIRLAIIASVCMAMIYGQSLKNPHRLEPLFRPANVLRGVRGGNDARDSSLGGGANFGPGDESSSGALIERQRDTGVAVGNPNASCGENIPKEIREAYGKRNRPIQGSAVTKSRNLSNHNPNSRYLATIIQKPMAERKSRTIGQADKGNDSRKEKMNKEFEIPRQCIGIIINPYFVLTTTICPFRRYVVGRQVKNGKEGRHSGVSIRRRKIQKKEAQYKNSIMKSIAVIPEKFKKSNYVFDKHTLKSGLKPKNIHIPPECEARMTLSRKRVEAGYPVECPVLMQLDTPIKQKLMPICLPANDTFDPLTQRIACIGHRKKQEKQKKPNAITDINPLNRSECEFIFGVKKLPEDMFCTKTEGALSKGDDGAPLVVYSPEEKDDTAHISLMGLLLQSGFMDEKKRKNKGMRDMEGIKSEKLPGSEEDDESKNLGETDMEDEGRRDNVKTKKAVKTQNVHVWIKLEGYMDWIIKTAFY